MRSIVLVALLVSFAAAQKKSAVVAPPLPPSTDELMVAEPARASWTPSEKVGLPKGAQVALIGADPISTGPTLYLKTPAGFHIPPHYHTHHEWLTFVSGQVTFTLDGKPHTLGPGAFVVVPGKTVHEFACGAGGECLVVSRRSGPTDFHWVPPSK
jgi:mannose-6-phosphate isomerase-like protein (cupin superfamily)